MYGLFLGLDNLLDRYHATSNSFAWFYMADGATFIKMRCTHALPVPFKKSKNGIVLAVRVQPRSSRRGIEGVSGDTLKVMLTAPPHDGAANEQLIELLSEELGIRKSSIGIIRGHGSRKKVVEIRGVETL